MTDDTQGGNRRTKRKPDPSLRVPATLEVHSHCVIKGRRANIIGRNEIIHSHEGGGVSHEHPDCGPSSYTIDKDDWFRLTGGMQGGGRKEFSRQPTGEQLPLVKRTPEQNQFEVIICDPPENFGGEGAGMSPVARILLGCKMNVVRFSDHRRRP